MLKIAWKRGIMWLSWACFLLFGVSCAVNPVSGRHQLMLMSQSDEAKLGRSTDAQVVREYGLYDNKALTGYVDSLCKRLGALSHRPNLPYNAKVLDTPVVNAFAVPGGYLYFTRGILAYINSEAELAGVMGHEIGHVAARHSAQQYSRAQLAQLGLGLGMVLSEAFRSFAEVAQFGAGMLFLKFSRDNERQADALGVEYATKAGYDAYQLGYFFKSLELMSPRSDKSGLPAWFSTHPNPADRVNMVKLKAKDWQARLGLDHPKTRREPYIKRIDGLVFGEDPRQGYVDGGIFYHPTLRLQFPVPARWKVQNTPTVVLMISPGKDANIFFTASSARSSEEAARSFVRKGHAQVLDSRRIRINGLKAHRLVSQVKTSQGMLRALSYFIQMGRNIYVLHGLTGAARFDKYAPLFTRTMGHFKRLRAKKRLNVKPDRIRVLPVKRAGPLREALLNLGATRDQLKTLALMNGKRLKDYVPRNSLLKLVVKGR